MPIQGGWTSYEDNGSITYYRGNLAAAEQFTMHLLRPAIYHYLQDTESAFVVLQDCKGVPLYLNTLYFPDLAKPTETTVAYLGPGVDGMTKLV